MRAQCSQRRKISGARYARGISGAYVNGVGISGWGCERIGRNLCYTTDLYTRTRSRTQDLSRFRLWKSPNRSRVHILPALELPREPPRRRGRARATWRRTPRSGRAERHAGTADRRDVLAVDAAASLQAARCRSRLLEHKLSPPWCAQAPAGRAAARRARTSTRALAVSR